MSAIDLTKIKTNSPLKFSEQGFVHNSALLYGAVLISVFLLSSLLYFVPDMRAWAYFPVSFILGLIGFALLDRYLNKKTKKEVLTLARIVKKYSKGDFSSPLPSSKNDAVDVLTGTIAQNFYLMHEKIERNTREKDKLSMMLRHMSEGVVGVSRDLSILICNPSAVQILGFEKNPMGRSLIELTHHPEIDSMMRGTIEKSESVSSEIEITYPEKKYLKISAAPTGAKEGLCGVLVLHDITEIKKLENLRKEFVANVSHELKTPLTSIKGFIEILQSGGMKNPDQAAHFLQLMKDDSERLHRLIEDLLTISSLESGTTVLKITPISLREEAEKVLTALNPQIIKKEIKIEVNIPEDFTRAAADRDKINQVFINLLDNAIKFSDQNGVIEISAKKKSGKIEVSVKDSGQGIPPEAVPRVFERFFRADKARNSEGGTGLGLAIVKHIIEAHGGNVSCQSILGRGAVLSFTLTPA